MCSTALVAEREAKFYERYPDIGPFFYSTVNGDTTLFKDSLMYFIQLSKQFLQKLTYQTFSYNNFLACVPI